MVALSALVDKPVRTSDGREVARVRDVIVHLDPSLAGLASAESYPAVAGLTTSGLQPADADAEHDTDGDEQCFIPWERVSEYGPDGLQLTAGDESFHTWQVGEDDVALRGDVLDRNVVDLTAKRVVRVNDVELAERAGALRVVGVDNGTGAIFRRLGLGTLGQRVLGRISRGTGQPPALTLIDWAQFVPIAESGTPLGRWWQSQGAHLGRLEPEELADLISSLTPRQAAALLRTLDPEQVADTVEQLDDEHQAAVLRAMEPEDAADVLDEMEPDEAADALQALDDVDQAHAADLLRRMTPEDAADVEELTAYPSNTAGGLMTTDYVAVPADMTAEQVLAALRKRARAAELGEAEDVPEALQEIYVVEGGVETAPEDAPTTARGGLILETEGRLIGVVAMRDLVLAEPPSPLASLMQEVDAVVHPMDDARQVARLMADEDLVALPVLDDTGILLGVVTIDDAIDVILPAAWRQRLPRRLM